ncbi:MAG: tRNA (uridine(34)/cytosine(34)/5-carboxymethylaminomethyluridine(34)-2'-O)-methyltransferase TrmL [Legionellales bacterium]
MFHIILYQPEIPPNTGNIIRLCANTGCHLHLIKPLGFTLEDKQLRRAGLDYDEWASVTQHDDLLFFKDKNVYAVTTKGKSNYTDPHYQKDDAFLFGPETRGLPPEILNTFPEDKKIRIPMLAHSRSLNLSNAAAVIVYEAWRQQGFNINSW